MIISHTRKFIFIKSAKTAGTSVEAALSNYCGGNDIVTPLNDYSFNRDEHGNFIHRGMNADEYMEIGQHADALTIRRRLPDRLWKEYLKISIARNPWDRLVSLFAWSTKGDLSLKPRTRFYHRLGFPLDELGRIRRSFARYVRGNWETNDRFYIIDGALCIDFLIRYEHLTDDFNGLCDMLELPRMELPRLKTGIRPAHYHYSQYYDDESQAIVAERHKNDIRFFGYTFTRAQCVYPPVRREPSAGTPSRSD